MVNPFTEGLVVQQLLGRLSGYPLSLYAATWTRSGWTSDREPRKVGVVITKRTRVHMSPAMRRLDALNTIYI